MKKMLTLVLALVMTLCMTASAIGEANLTVWLNHTWYPTDEFVGIIPEAITAATGTTLTPTRALDDGQTYHH